MPLKLTGEISFSEIASEFFVTQKPYRLSEFYRGSLKVPDTELNIGVPRDGTIAYSDFYGTAYAIPPTIPAGTIIFRDVASTEPAPAGWQSVYSTGSYFIQGTSDTAKVGTTSLGSLPAGVPQSDNGGETGSHSASTFRAGDMGATAGSVRGYPAPSNTGALHRHAVVSIPSSTIGSDIPYPPFKRLMLLKATADTQVLPSDTVTISANQPSPAWTRISSTNDYTYLMSGKDPAFNSGNDSSTGLTKTYASISSTGGAHYHTISSNSYYYNAGTNTSVYAGAVSGDHDHDCSATVKTNKMIHTYVNLWKAAQSTIAGNNSVFMYEGDIENLPQDWYLCNGLNGTVNLVDRCLAIGRGTTATLHGVENLTNELDITYSSFISRTVAHTHRQDNQFTTRRTYAANISHAQYNWSHSHTAPAKKITTGNVYSPPVVRLGFIQYIKDNPNISSITVTNSSTSVNEGASVNFTITPVNFPAGTKIYWRTVAVAGYLDAGDFTDNALEGEITVTIAGVNIVFTRTLVGDLKEEGIERFRVDFFNSASRTVLIGSSQDVEIADTSLPQYAIQVLGYDNSNYIYVNEDDTVEIEFKTSVINAGTTMYWTLTTGSTATSADFTDGAVNGSFVLAANGAYRTAIISRTIKADALTEAEEYFQVQVRINSITGTVRATSQRIYIRDTSITPTYQSVSASASNLNETASYSFTFQGTNVPTGGELVYWSIDTYDAGSGETTISDTTDFVERSGSILAPAGTGNQFTVTVYGSNDNRTEPNEFYKLSLRRGSTTGTVIADTLLVIQIISTSNATYSLTTSSTNINWGQTVSFTLTRTAGTHGTNTVFYIETTDWLTGDFSTPQIVRHPIGTSSTYTWSVNTRSSTSKAGKTFKVNVYNDNPYPSSGLVTASLIASSPTITISPVGYVGITGSPNQSVINEGTQITWTVQTEGFSNGKIVYWGIDFGSGTTNYGAITQNILAAGAATEPYRTLFNTVVSGRRLGDMDNSGSVTANDALIYANWANNPNSVTSSQAANCQATTTYLVNNSGTYGWAIANPTTSADFTTNVLGSGSVNNNQVSISYTLSNDATTEGNEKFRLKIYDNSARTVEVLSSTWYSINDTSLAPVINSLTPSVTTVNEGSSVSFEARGANHTAVNTTYYYRVVATQGTFNTSDITATTFDGTLTYSRASESGSAVISLVNDLTTEGVEKFRMDLYSNSTRTILVASSTVVTVNDTSISPTYTFTSTPSSVNEGASATFSVRTTNVPNNTRLYWSINYNSSTAAADFSTTEGNFLISNNVGSFTVTTAADATTEGSQTFRVYLRTGSTTGTIVANSGIVTINDTSLSPTYTFGTIPTVLNEGSAGTFNVNTTNVTNGTTLYWTVKHVTTNASDFTTSSGSFSITSNRGSFTVTPAADLSTDGATETFQVEIRTGSATGTVRATSASVSVNDTSLTQPGQFERTTGGSSIWVCPNGVTSVSVVCIGGGGGGKYNGGGGGAGGNLAYKNNYTVSPGTTYYLVAGRGGLGSASGTAAAGNGTVSYFGTSSTTTNANLFAGSGSGGLANGTGGLPGVGAPPAAAGVTTFLGGQGGNGTTRRGPGGGGAGGYTGAGGRGGGNQGNPTAGVNGGGGGGWSAVNYGGAGGGTRLLGSGANGAAGTSSTTTIGGTGGAGGAGTGLGYGGGGPGDNSNATASTLNGKSGGVRIMWPGNLRSYPSTRTANE